MLIVVGGMIGLGKTTVSEIVAEHLGSKVFYEKVDGNPILSKFYTASPEDQEKYRYPFLLQLYFLNSRFASIKEAMYDDNNVLDRSIYEDHYFAMINHKLGRINDMEIDIYKDLLDNMMEELEGTPKKAPDLMIYLKGSFDTVLSRIRKRNRGFEDASQTEYFHLLWDNYDEWVNCYYDKSDILEINMDEFDVTKEEDKQRFIELLDSRLDEIRNRNQKYIPYLD